ncbi:hypothetical protein HWV62_27033 [Athelia sp. TMB]|nr:hypothetical protein HWV62_27033 [Athelia sp. TMB]
MYRAVAAAVIPESKPSIYPAPETQLLLQEVHSPLEAHIGAARRQTTDALAAGHAQVQGAVDRWIGVEHVVESRVKSLLAPEEPLTPGILYVAVAALSGSILTRARALPLRVALPPLLFCAASAHFLPKTSANVAEYVGELEERYVPAVKQFQDTGIAHSQMGWAQLKEALGEGRKRVAKTAEGAVGRVQEGTGLKLRETLGWAGEAKASAKEEVGKVTQAIKEKASEAKSGIDAKIEHAKEVGHAKIEEVREVGHAKIEHAKEVAEEQTEKVKDEAHPKHLV